jgi:hypothetical protein
MKYLKIFLIAILLILLGAGAYLIFVPYSEGSKAGTIIKLSKKGWIFKTYEGQLNQGMVVSEQAAANYMQLWEFSVDEDEEEVIKALNEAMLTGKRAQLHYREKFFRFFWLGDTKYFVDEVEVLK